MFGAISASNRREILLMLSKREMPVTELADAFDMTMSAVSQHLSILRDAGLVDLRKEGRKRIYHLTPEPLSEVADWIEFYKPFWTDRLEKLGQYLEENP